MQRAPSRFSEPAVRVVFQYEGKQFVCVTASRAIVGLGKEFYEMGWRYPRNVMVREEQTANGSYIFFELVF